MEIPSFATALFECDDASSLKLAAGNRFIRKLPDDRSLGYLHKFYAPVDQASVQRSIEVIGDRLPEAFASFLQWSNGATLFDNHLHIFGLPESFSRSVEPEDQQPISIIDSNRTFTLTDRWRDGWTIIGAVVGWDSSYEVQLHEEGLCLLTSEAGFFSAASFEQCLATIIDRIGICFSCDGLIDSSHADIEAALSSLVRLQ